MENTSDIMTSKRATWSFLLSASFPKVFWKVPSQFFFFWCGFLSLCLWLSCFLSKLPLLLYGLVKRLIMETNATSAPGFSGIFKLSTIRGLLHACVHWVIIGLCSKMFQEYKQHFCRLYNPLNCTPAHVYYRRDNIIRRLILYIYIYI